MSGYVKFPSLSHRSALECKDQVVGHQPCDYKRTDAVDPFSELSGGENSPVEKKNGYLDSGCGRTIN